MRTMIEQDQGPEPATGHHIRRLHEVTTEAEDYPQLDDEEVRDLHTAWVELERLDFASRHAAQEYLDRGGWDLSSPAASIRRAIYFAVRSRTFH